MDREMIWFSLCVEDIMAVARIEGFLEKWVEENLTYIITKSGKSIDWSFTVSDVMCTLKKDGVKK